MVFIRAYWRVNLIYYISNNSKINDFKHHLIKGYNLYTTCKLIQFYSNFLLTSASSSWRFT
jgi:hypothetical protein